MVLNGGIENGYGVYVKSTSFTGKIGFEYSMLSYNTGIYTGTGQIGNGTGTLPNMDYTGANRNSFNNFNNQDTEKHKLFTTVNSSIHTAYIAGHNGNPMKITMIYAISD